MRIQLLRETPPPELAAKLEAFEAAFTYPLGPGRWFRISHSPDYTRFYRSMGDAACFIAQKNDQIIGTLSIAIRDLTMPDGSTRRAAYIGDLKIRPDARSSRALVRLAQAADDWSRPQVSAAYGVVMDGTGSLPSAYSGRAGIEPFRAVGKVMVLRLLTDLEPALDVAQILDPGQAYNCIVNLTSTSACGALEDTRKAKRLIGNDGIEMISMHLSGFAYSNPASGAKLLRWACATAKSHGMPALFVSVRASQFSALNEALGPIQKVVAPATIYGAGLETGGEWIVNTSEI